MGQERGPGADRKYRARRSQRIFRDRREGTGQAQDLRALADVHATRIAERPSRTLADARYSDGTADGVGGVLCEYRDRVAVRVEDSLLPQPLIQRPASAR